MCFRNTTILLLNCCSPAFSHTPSYIQMYITYILYAQETFFGAVLSDNNIMFKALTQTHTHTPSAAQAITTTPHKPPNAPHPHQYIAKRASSEHILKASSRYIGNILASYSARASDDSFQLLLCLACARCLYAKPKSVRTPRVRLSDAEHRHDINTYNRRACARTHTHTAQHNSHL